MIYRIHYETEGGSSAGYQYAGSKAEAIRMIKEQPDSRGRWPNYTYIHISGDDGFGDDSAERERIQITSEPTPRTKAGWLVYLNTHGSHPDNG
tara:strand:- start:115 stop:393 length:279 start_codon:yes stop_codon:yes gene_type:complete